MANLDNATTPFKANIVSLVISDGAGNSLTLALLQGSVITWTEPGRTAVEARQQGRHQTTPVVVETDDGNVTGSMQLLVSSWKGSSNTHPYEFLTKTGNASGYTSRGVGGAWIYRLVATFDSTVDGGGAQTATFGYVHTDSIDGDPAGVDGLTAITVNFTDYESRPTFA